ncbi:MAG: VanZ family protein [Endomicrobia bacterium]|nr:VanZ family protein [Endomicrobiia bacterium]
MKNKKFLAWVYVVIWCGIIFYFSSIPHLKIETLGIWDFIFRKIAHMVEYFILVILIFRAFTRTTKLHRSKIYFWSIFLSVMYAISDEFHQHFVPGRYFSLYDILIDIIGITFGSFVWNRKERKEGDKYQQSSYNINKSFIQYK